MESIIKVSAFRCRPHLMVISSSPGYPSLMMVWQHSVTVFHRTFRACPLEKLEGWLTVMYRIYSNKCPYSNKRPLPSLERSIHWLKTSNNRPSPGPTWTILHHISGNTNFSIAKCGQCLFNQETDFLFVRTFSNYAVLRWDVHTPTSSPRAFGCTAGHTRWDSEDPNSVQCAQNVKQGLTQALWNISDNNFPFLYHNCCTAVSVFLVHDGLWL